MEDVTLRHWIVPFFGFGAVVVFAILVLFFVYTDANFEALSFFGDSSQGGVMSMQDFKQAMQGKLK